MNYLSDPRYVNAHREAVAEAIRFERLRPHRLRTMGSWLHTWRMEATPRTTPDPASAPQAIDSEARVHTFYRALEHYLDERSQRRAA